MRNLKLSTELTSILELQSENETIQFAAFDIEKNRLFFASSTNFIYTAQLPSIHVYILISVLKFIDFIDRLCYVVTEKFQFIASLAMYK